MSLDLDDKTMIFESHLTRCHRRQRLYASTFTLENDCEYDARQILASKMTLNLNDPCKIEDTSWIKPVKYVGVCGK
jgi:hypothetical protein